MAVTLKHSITTLQATALNMSQMCGVGPFITIPAMVAVMHGPQAILGWIAGALLALCDGLIWAELGAAMPGSGGSYVYLREAFKQRTGYLMPFLFVWTAILFVPLTMSTGVLGFVQYLGYLFPQLSFQQGNLVGIALILCVLVLLWRNIDAISRQTTLLWGIMLVTVISVIAACFSHFDIDRFTSLPAHSFDFSSTSFWMALIAGMTVGVYDYLGYNTSAYLAGELKDPATTLPRSVIYSVLGIMAIYLLMQVGMLGIVPWQEMLNPHSNAFSALASVAVERSWGHTAAIVITLLILIAAFTSFMVGLLSGSRIPYEAARDGVFFKSFSHLHPQKQFPVYGVAIMVGMTVIGFLIGRTTGITLLIQLLTTVMILIQSFGQIAALVVLRRRQPTSARPYHMWLYPFPLLVSTLGWGVIFLSADNNAPGLHPIELSIGWLIIGILAYLPWALRRQSWPFNH